MKKHYLAVDLGASSGRTIVGTLEDGKLTLKEMNRFWNGPTEVRGTLLWDFVHLFRNIKEGIALAKKEFGDGLVSMGIDTWGVDFGLFDADGNLLRNPVNYRDSRTAGMFEKVFERVPREEVFAQTGIQFMELNTLYQLMALSLEDSFQYRSATKLLFSPDLLSYWLTGNMVAERSIASTSQFYNPATKDWAYDLLEKLNIRTDLFADLVDPGTVIGDADGLPVVAVGGHDTASAFAAVPVKKGEHCAFLSSGTWSLLGTELTEPVINDASLAANFTNEVGVCDTVRFLKNLSGLWMIQELRRGWNEQDFDYSWAAMEHMALETEPFEFFIDPSDEVFLAPGDMAGRIQDYCERTGQARPQTHAQIIRAAYEGLALLYASVYESLEQLAGRTLDTLRIVGGGCKDTLLDQLAANATGRKVVTGPTEATATGNLIMQMLAMGDIQSLEEGREIIRNSFAEETREFEPQDSDAWQTALTKWRDACRG
ncbi:rhamnulokinase [Pontiella sulfatireligans]|uniref:L-Rhamnulokinase n=1 Tax=Pontiella sulfatireligans TaxID=2750658 RepID=A0A6C2UUJ3_9BACT|nr:rhamnulokinase family protein [Pontiella sulfatireligans]VGO23021.1 L-Rhamnulokinase [Pontiella sulfatireligans]